MLIRCLKEKHLNKRCVAHSSHVREVKHQTHSISYPCLQAQVQFRFLSLVTSLKLHTWKSERLRTCSYRYEYGNGDGYRYGYRYNFPLDEPSHVSHVLWTMTRVWSAEGLWCAHLMPFKMNESLKIRKSVFKESKW